MATLPAVYTKSCRLFFFFFVQLQVYLMRLIVRRPNGRGIFKDELNSRFVGREFALFSGIFQRTFDVTKYLRRF